MLGIVDQEERGVNEVNEVSHLLDHRAWGGFTRIDRSSLTEDMSVGDSDLVFLGCLAQINQGTDSRGSFGMIHGSVLGSSSSLFDGLHNSSTFDEVQAYAEAILNLDGSFSFILTSNHGVIVGRDCMGGKPLYLGRKGPLKAISSEVKPLRGMGLEVEHFPPGRVHLLEQKKDIFKFTSKDLVQKKKDSMSLSKKEGFRDLDGGQLLDQLELSVTRRVGTAKRIAIAFSGGIDSSLIAFIAKRHTRVVGIAVGVESSIDQLEAKGYAELIGIDLMQVQPTTKEIQQLRDKIRNLAEVTTPMDESIALGFHLAAKASRNAGCDKMFVGQLADELFGGYARYVRAYCSGTNDVLEMMATDVMNAAEHNFERDEKASSPFVDLEIPYASLGVIEYGLLCPANRKFDCSTGIGKVILRKAAITAGLPERIALRSKKAIQYSSGLLKILSKLG